RQVSALVMAITACSAKVCSNDQVEHRLRIAGRDRHHLQYFDSRGLMRDPLAIRAVACRQLGTAFVELGLEFFDRLLGVGCRRVERRGQASAPAGNRTSSDTRMYGMVLLA